MTEFGDAYDWDTTSAFVASKGFSEHFRTGNAPRSDYGTLHYFKRPDDPVNSNGMPLEYATLMLKDGRWLVAIFETRPRATLHIVGGTDYSD